MSKHTPGPWLVHGAAICSDSGQVVAYVKRTADKLLDQKKADLALIAAAPDLLEALREARQELRFHNLTKDGGQRTNTAISRALVTVDAAIAKAEGA